MCQRLDGPTVLVDPPAIVWHSLALFPEPIGPKRASHATCDHGVTLLCDGVLKHQCRVGTGGPRARPSRFGG